MLVNAKSLDEMILMHAIVHLIERHVTKRSMRLLGERPPLACGPLRPIISEPELLATSYFCSARVLMHATY